MKRSGRIAIVLLAVVCVAGAQIKSQTLKVDVDLVQVFATVTDQFGHYVVGLEPPNFQVFEYKIEQKVETFSSEDVPMSVGVILDASSSMKPSLSLAKDAAVTFLKLGNPEDEYFLVEFNDRAQITEDFTTDIHKLENHLIFIPAKGRTALFDGVYLGLSRVREGSNPRKFLLVITDGGDNHSRYGFTQVRQYAREQDVQVYVIAVAGGGGNAAGEGTINDIVELTGGRRFFARSANDLEDICTKIAIEVKNQYVIGYHSTNETHDGKYRHIRVKVNPPKGMSQMFVRAKEGYYPPTDKN
jgi:Ca-activated chloride channel family protein